MESKGTGMYNNGLIITHRWNTMNNMEDVE
ncbi:hypothetical protein AR505_1366 [methanogenic archaeon ISO4-H5]|nr:hypothetical protein AR505_1366 [methanogenic archaeon ISO4-H5]